MHLAPGMIAPLVGQELSGFTSGSENDNGSHLLPLPRIPGSHVGTVLNGIHVTSI